MFYIDKVFIGQFLDQKMPVKVFSNEEWYEIADPRDLEDDITGIGYDVYGGDHRFDYRNIEQIKVGNRPPLDLEGLQAMKTGQKPTEEKPEKKDSEDEPMSDEEPASEEKPEKEPDLSWYSPAFDVGRKIIHEAKRSKV